MASTEDPSYSTELTYEERYRLRKLKREMKQQKVSWCVCGVWGDKIDRCEFSFVVREMLCSYRSNKMNKLGTVIHIQLQLMAW